MEKRWYFTKIFIIVVSQLQEVENNLFIHLVKLE